MRTVRIDRGKSQNQIFESRGVIANLEETFGILLLTSRRETHDTVGENVMSNIGGKLLATVIEDLSVIGDQMFQFRFGAVLHASGEGVNEDPLLNDRLIRGNLRNGRTQLTEDVQSDFSSSSEQLIDTDLQFIHR